MNTNHPLALLLAPSYSVGLSCGYCSDIVGISKVYRRQVCEDSELVRLSTNGAQEAREIES
jgi:hypothetical protein